VVKFHFNNSKLREKHFSTKRNYWEISNLKNQDVQGPPAPSFRRPCTSECVWVMSA